MIGRTDDNGRYGGGKGGAEHRYSFPAVDDDRWDEAKRGKDTVAKWQGQAGEVVGAYVNTTEAPRGNIMGATINTSWPQNGFK